jgi:hypothetical protein
MHHWEQDIQIKIHNTENQKMSNTESCQTALSVISTLSALHHAIKDCQRYEKEPELHFGLSSKYDLISHALL